jgi:RNase P subunit RPR2
LEDSEKLYICDYCEKELWWAFTAIVRLQDGSVLQNNTFPTWQNKPSVW